LPITIKNNNNNKAKCRPGGILRILAGKNVSQYRTTPQYRQKMYPRKKCIPVQTKNFPGKINNLLLYLKT
jgi:hypothetical protein